MGKVHRVKLKTNPIFWTYLLIHCRNVVLIHFSKHQGKFFWSKQRAVVRGSAVMPTISWLLRIKIKSLHYALFLPVRTRAQESGGWCASGWFRNIWCAHENIAATGTYLGFKDWKCPKSHSINICCDSLSAAVRCSQQPELKHTFSGAG